MLVGVALVTTLAVVAIVALTRPTGPGATSPDRRSWPLNRRIWVVRSIGTGPGSWLRSISFT